MALPKEQVVKTENGPVAVSDAFFSQTRTAVRLWVYEPAKPVGSWRLEKCPPIVKTPGDPHRRCVQMHFKETHEPVLCTPYLRFLRADHTWVLASSLAVGDWVVGARGNLSVHAVTRAALYDRTMYEIQGDYTLYDDGPCVSGTAPVLPVDVAAAPARWV